MKTASKLIRQWLGLACFALAPVVMAQPVTTAPNATTTAAALVCPDRSLLYWQAFPPGGESDLSARHQQLVLKKSAPPSTPSSSTRPARAAGCFGRK